MYYYSKAQKAKDKRIHEDKEYRCATSASASCKCPETPLCQGFLRPSPQPSLLDWAVDITYTSPSALHNCCANCGSLMGMTIIN